MNNKKNKVLHPFFESVENIFYKAGIEFYGVIPFSECRIILPHKIAGCGFDVRSVIVFIAPYYSREIITENNNLCNRTISVYAVPRDYHVFFAELFAELEEELNLIYPEIKFKGFSDDSPIGEVGAGARAKLGVIGENGLLLNKKYGSFIFIGEILVDLEIPEQDQPLEVEFCDGCGKCREVCPRECIEGDELNKRKNCLSALTQSKSAPDEETANLMRDNITAWGCDECQLVCPYNRSPEETPIEWFKKELIASPTSDILNNLSDEEFARRAFAWRGRNVIERNIKIICE